MEAQACGVPVIAYGRGGALETVVGLDDPDGRDPTGVFFEEQTVEGLLAGVEAFEKVERSLAPDAARAQALRFDRPRFKDALRRSVGREFSMVLGPAEEYPAGARRGHQT